MTGETAALPDDEERLIAVLLATGVADSDAVQAAIGDNGGVAVGLRGGNIIGLFGAHRSEGEEIPRAASAALACRHAAERVAVGSGRATSSRAGISGTAVRAAEEGCLAAVLGVAVDRETARALGPRFSLRPVAGRISEIIAERRDSIAPAQGSPTIGRDRELEVIGKTLAGAFRDSSARGLVFTGPPGIGKSRLRLETECLLAGWTEPARVLCGSGEPLRRGAALSLWVDALWRHAVAGSAQHGWPRIEAHAPVVERRQAVMTLVRQALPDAAAAQECALFLGELCGVAMPEGPSLRAAREDPQLMADRFRLAVLDYFAGLAAQGPLALLLEDLHWADGAALELADALLDRLRDAPFLFFASWRTDWTSAPTQLLGRADVVRIDLGGLSADEVEGIVANIAGHSLPAAVCRQISEVSDGNPLFVEHIVRALADTAEPAGEDARALPMPVTVEAAIQSRLDHLPAREKDLCKRASVFARPFREDELQALGVSEPAGLLAALRSRELVAVHAALPAGGSEYRFRSTLTAEVAYRMMAPAVREELHRGCAATLGAAPNADAEEVASHLERGGQAADAAAWYARAARAAVTRGDSATVLRCSDNALRLGVADDQRFDLHVGRSDALRFLGRRDEQATEIEQALKWAASGADRARVLAEKSAWLARVGRTDEAIECAQTAVQTGRTAKDPAVLAVAEVRHAEALTFAGRFAEAEACLHAASQLAAGAESARAKIVASQAFVAVAVGDVGKAREAYTRAIALLGAAGDVRRAATNEQNLADIYNRVGAYAEAEQALGAALEGCRKVRNRLAEGWVLANLGYAQTRQGRPDEALASLTEAGRLAEQTGYARLGLFVRIYRARALSAAGRAPEAVVEAEQAAALAEELGHTGLLVVALTVGAQAQLQIDAKEAALALSTRALSLRDELGGVEEEEGEVFVTHMLALQACGRRADAEQVRARGRQRIEALAARIEDPDWRRRFLGDVAAHRTLLARS